MYPRLGTSDAAVRLPGRSEMRALGKLLGLDGFNLHEFDAPAHRMRVGWSRARLVLEAWPEPEAFT